VSQMKVILENLVSSENAIREPTSMEFDQRWQTTKPNTIPTTDNAISEPKGAKVGDSQKFTPIGAFKIDTVPSKIDSPRFSLKKSDITRNVSGSLDSVESDVPEMDSWVKGVAVNDEEDEKLVRNISEAIRDLDLALALEKTSSESSSHNSPKKDHGPRVDFKLGGNTSSFIHTPKTFELSSLQNTMEPQSLLFNSLIFPEAAESLSVQSSLFDAEEEVWKKRIERGEFSEKVKEKSKSIADLMVLTHIEPSDESDEDKNSFSWRQNNPKLSLTCNNFGSDSDIRHAVLEAEFEENLKRLSHEHKEHGRFESLTVIVPDEAKRVNIIKSLQWDPKSDFLWKTASDSECFKNSSQKMNENNTDMEPCDAKNEEKLTNSQNINQSKANERNIFENNKEHAEEKPISKNEKPCFSEDLNENVLFDNPKKSSIDDNETTDKLNVNAQLDIKPVENKIVPDLISVVMGPFEDHTLGHYQAITTRYGEINTQNGHFDQLDNVNRLLEATQPLFGQPASPSETNFDNTLFPVEKSEPNTMANVIEPIITDSSFKNTQSEITPEICKPTESIGENVEVLLEKHLLCSPENKAKPLENGEKHSPTHFPTELDPLEINSQDLKDERTETLPLAQNQETLFKGKEASIVNGLNEATPMELEISSQVLDDNRRSPEPVSQELPTVSSELSRSNGVESPNLDPLSESHTEAEPIINSVTNLGEFMALGYKHLCCFSPKSEVGIDNNHTR